VNNILDWWTVNHFGVGSVGETGSCWGLGRKGSGDVSFATEQEMWHSIRATLKARLNDLVWNLHDGTACVGGSEQ
jgi:hypothetical protein